MAIFFLNHNLSRFIGMAYSNIDCTWLCDFFLLCALCHVIPFVNIFCKSLFTVMVSHEKYKNEFIYYRPINFLNVNKKNIDKLFYSIFLSWTDGECMLSQSSFLNGKKFSTSLMINCKDY